MLVKVSTDGQQSQHPISKREKSYRKWIMGLFLLYSHLQHKKVYISTHMNLVHNVFINDTTSIEYTIYSV